MIKSRFIKLELPIVKNYYYDGKIGLQWCTDGTISLQSKQEIVFKKDKATLHVISKRCEETVIIPIKLEGNPLTLIYSKVCR